jgi:hypothetical protein
MKYQTLHNNINNPYRYQSYTAVVQQETYDVFHSLMDNFFRKPDNTLFLDVGIAFRHPDDQFNKKIGRALALERLKTTPFKVEVIFNFDDHFLINFTSNEDVALRHTLQVKIYKDSKKVRYVSYYVKKMLKITYGDLRDFGA